MNASMCGLFLTIVWTSGAPGSNGATWTGLMSALRASMLGMPLLTLSSNTLIDRMKSAPSILP